jgi:hypothetical protein
MKMIRNTTDPQRLCVQVAADPRNVSVDARTNIGVQPWLAILGAENDVNDDLAQRLGHCWIVAEKHAQVNRAFSADNFS